MKKKIVFILPSLNSGGAEKVIVSLCNNLNYEKFEIVLVVLNKEGIFKKQLKDSYKTIDLKCPRVRNIFFKIRKIIYEEKPDIVFTTLGHLNLFFGIFRWTFSKKIKFIGREATVVSEHYKGKKIKNIIFRVLYRLFYSNLDNVIAQCDYMKSDLIKNFKVNSEKIKVINNPLDIDGIRILSEKEAEKLLGEKILLTIGRLNKVKQHKIMIELFSKLDFQKDYKLYIMGEGEEKENILKFIREKKLENCVVLLGKKNNPFSYIKQANIFLLTSKYEGFPNVALEAMALNIPVLSFKSPGGILEILKEGENGYFINRDNFKEKLELAFKLDKDQIGKTVEKYRISKIIKEYEDFFMELNTDV
ncbi:MAG: glycosyltransferase [Fusobacterium varium]|uniref:glycosyltransferase n=1 Tax=Fusobacterium varium TaxID=856 RepID=UPI00242FB1F7|nr:glycosyltransferase [Fusobacterium varium]UYI79860.1 MAG: glycosyltransferase [Fusobacterium varium]